MLGYETKLKLAELILELAEAERQIEVVRQILCEQRDFEPYAAFRRLDRPRRGSVIAKDLQNFLSENSIDHAERTCAALIKRYSLKDPSELNYAEFLNSVLPQNNPELRSTATQRQNYDVQYDEYLSADIEYALAKVFDRELSFILSLDNQKYALANRYDYNNLDAFASIDKFNTGRVDYDNLKAFFKTLNMFPYEEELIAALRRMDKNDDGVLSYKEFCEGLAIINEQLAYTVKASPSKYSKPLGHNASPYQGSTGSARRSSPMRAVSPFAAQDIFHASPRVNASPHPNASPTHSRINAASPRPRASPNRSQYSPSRRSPSVEEKRDLSRRIEALSEKMELSRSNQKPVKASSFLSATSPNKYIYEVAERKISTSASRRTPDHSQRSVPMSVSPMKYTSAIKSTSSINNYRSPVNSEKKKVTFTGQVKESPQMYSSPVRGSANRSATRGSKDRSGFLSRDISPITKDSDYKSRVETKEISGFLSHHTSPSPARKGSHHKRGASSVLDDVRRNLGRSGSGGKSNQTLVHTMKQFIFMDKDLEVAKQNVALRPDFNLLDFFRVFDIEGKGTLTSSEVQQGMKKFGVNAEKDELYMFVRRYDWDNDGRLKFSEFSEAFAPKQSEYSSLLNNRTPLNGDLSMSVQELFSSETQKAITRVIRLHLDNENATESLRHKLNTRSDFNTHEAFNDLDINDNGFITLDELRVFFEQHDAFATEKELNLLLARLDHNKEGRVAYSRFVQEFTPKILPH